MATKTIGQLPPASTVAGATFVIEQGGVTKNLSEALLGDVSYQVISGQATRSSSNRWGEFVSAYEFTGFGTNATSNVAALNAAVNSNISRLWIPPGTYELNGTVTRTTTTPLHIIGHGVTFKLSNGAIVNTDSDYDQHVCLFDFRGPDLLVWEGITLDGNRANQTYPTSQPASNILLGTGLNGYRDNALLRITARSSSIGGGRVIITDAEFKNAYLNGVAAIEVDDLQVSARFIDCTWNGLALSSCNRTLITDSCYFYQCGVSTQWPVEYMPDGADRGGVQARGRSADFTEISQGYPVLSTLRPNGIIRVGAAVVEKSSIIGMYFRAVQTLIMRGTTIVDPGESVPTGYVYKPAGIWWEWTERADVADVVVERTSASTGERPDGIVAYSMENAAGTTTGGDPIPVQGPGISRLTNAIVRYRRTVGVPDTTQVFERGIRANQGFLGHNLHVEDCAVAAVYLTNSASFVASCVDAEINGLHVARSKRVVELTQYSGGYGVSGVVKATLRGIRFSNMSDSASGAEDRILITTPSSWLSVGTKIVIDDLIGDAANQAGGDNFIVARLRSNNTSRLQISNWQIENPYEGAQIYNFETCLVNNVFQKAGRIAVYHLASTGMQNSGTLSIDSLDTLNLTLSPIQLSPGTYTLDRIILQNIRPVSSTSVGILGGYNPTYHLALVAGESVTAFASHSLPATMQRSIAAAIGDASATLTAWSPRHQRCDTALTANRTITLPSSGVKNGDWFHITRGINATGSFNLTVGAVVTLTAAGQWCLVMFDGSSWTLRARGTLT